MNEQLTVDRLAALAAPHLSGLLRLRSATHVYDPSPGAPHSKATVEGGEECTLDQLKRAAQPYKNIERFLSAEKVMQYIIGPGLLPIAVALSKAILGKRVLVTRKVAPMKEDKGVTGHLDGFGVRIMMYFDATAGETIVEWTCLYGVR